MLAGEGMGRDTTNDAEDGESGAAAQRRTTGERAEQLVVEFLRRRGVAIVATNLRLGSLEIDIVAREGPVVLVVEVRTRSERSWTTAFGSIGARKQKHLRRAGERLWRERYRHDATVDRLRYDVAAVRWASEGPVIEYVRGAF